MSFTDGKPRIATEADCEACWSGGGPGERFRCYLCGVRFQPGSAWRFVYCAKEGLINILVCATCDGDDVQERWKLHTQDAERRFWWLMERPAWPQDMERSYHYRNAENYTVKDGGGSSCSIKKKDANGLP